MGCAAKLCPSVCGDVAVYVRVWVWVGMGVWVRTRIYVYTLCVCVCSISRAPRQGKRPWCMRACAQTRLITFWERVRKACVRVRWMMQS